MKNVPVIADSPLAATVLLSTVCLSLYRRDILYFSNVCWHIRHMNHQSTHKTLYIRKPIHPGYLCIQDQTRPDQTRPQHTTPDHITKRPFTFMTTRPRTKLSNMTTSTYQKNYQKDNTESALFTLSCLFNATKKILCKTYLFVACHTQL